MSRTHINRRPNEIARDRQIISEMYLRGKLQHEIAEKLGRTQSHISLELAAIRKQWEKSTLFNFNEQRCRELAKIDQLERTYWEAWERSLGKISQTTQSFRSEDGEVVMDKGTQQERELSGNPAYLVGVERCIEMRVKLLGLNSPQIMQLVNESFDMEKWIADRSNRLADVVSALAGVNEG